MEIGTNIKFFNDKIVVDVWHEDTEKWIETPISVLNLSLNRYMRNIVEFDSDLTLEGFMKQLQPYIETIDNTFLGSSYGFKLKPFYDDLEKESTVSGEKITKIEFYWISEIWEGELSEYISFHGYHDNDNTQYSLSFLSVKDYKDAKMIINNSYEIMPQFNHNEDYKAIISTKKQITLYELLDAWIYELTFSGFPEDQEKFVQTVMTDINNIKESVSFSTLEDVLIESKEYSLNKAIENEDYEKAEILKKEIEDLKKRTNGQI